MDREDVWNAAQRWLEYLKIDRRLSERTVVTYKSSLTCWLNPLPAEPTRRDLQASLSERMPRDQKAVAYNSWVAVEGFLRWWEGNGGPPAVTRAMRKPPKPRTHRAAMTEAQVAIGINRLAATTDLKAKAICYLIIFCGPRISEVGTLQVEDLDFTAGRERIRFRDRKGGESDDWLPTSPRLAQVLAEYLRSHRIPAGYVFPGPNGRMTNAGLAKAWHRVLGDLPVTPHQGRHYFATRLLRLGYDIFTVSRHLGHASITSTQIYLDYEQDLGRKGVSDLADHIEQQAAQVPLEPPMVAPGPGKAWRRGRRALQAPLAPVAIPELAIELGSKPGILQLHVVDGT